MRSVLPVTRVQAHRFAVSLQANYHLRLLRFQRSAHLPTATMKEELHHIPAGWTAVKDTDDRHRHKAVANAWHVGIATIFLALLLATPITPAAAAVPAPTLARDPHPLGHTAIEQMATIWHSAPLLTTQGAASTAEPNMTTLTDRWEHWRLADHQQHLRTTTRELEPELLKTLKLWHHWHEHLPELRSRVTTEMQQLPSDLRAQQHIWHKQLKPHIQRLYDPNGPGSIHFPLLQHIATTFGWGDPTLLDEIQPHRCPQPWPGMESQKRFQIFHANRLQHVPQSKQSIHTSKAGHGSTRHTLATASTRDRGGRPQRAHGGAIHSPT